MKKLILIGAMVIAGAACAMGSVKIAEGAKAATKEYTWYRATGDLADGEYMIVSQHVQNEKFYYLKSDVANLGNGAAAEVTNMSADRSVIKTTSEKVTWSIRKNGDFFNIFHVGSTETTYIGKTGSGNGISTSTTTPFDLEFTADGTGYAISGGEFNDRYLRSGNGSTGTTVNFSFPQVYSVVELYSATKPSETFSNKFLNAELCDGGVTAPSSLDWQELSAEFALLSTDEKNVLKNATASQSGTVVEQCVARYDYIVAKYGASTYADFMGREPAQATSGALLGNFDNNITTIIVVSAAAVVLFASYIILKKRKASVSR